MRWRLICLALLLPGTVVADETLQARPANIELPNIVLIISDDQSWTDYSFMGHDVIETPSIDRLASEGAVFTRGYVPTSLCRPSLATIITGLYPHQHGVTGNDPTASKQGRAGWKEANEALIENGVASNPTIPRELAKLGYVSHQSGKWWEGNYANGGFTEGMTHGDPARGGRHGDVGLKIGRDVMDPVTNFIDKAIGEGKPFFVWYAPFLPHTPHNPPQQILQKYQAKGRDPALAKYYAMVEWFDETCGQLLDHLDQAGVADNTIVLYVTDNGWIQKTEDTELPTGWNQSFAPRSKRAPQDGGVRTPIIIRWPNHVKPGKRQELASSIDLMPTILNAVGLEPTDKMQGIDLIAVAAMEGPQREAVYGEIFRHDIPDLHDPSAGLYFRWIVDGDWKLILPTEKVKTSAYAWNAEDKAVQLYHIAVDPHEQKNLAEEKLEKVEELTKKLDAWWAATSYRPNRDFVERFWKFFKAHPL